ncbi:MAG: transglutaminase family protein, partial [Alphaproteobacteria bacterium]|nr:transglutaminase family protein [Alphaproteobacteria bacterium]
MILTIDVTMDYALEPGDPVLLMIAVLPSDVQTLLHADLHAQGARLHWLEQAGAAGQRVWVLPEGARLQAAYRARVDITRRAPALQSLSAAPMHALPTQALTALRPSLFCPSDRFGPFVQDQFGHLAGGARVAAMSDWVAGHLRYVPGASGPSTTALDTFVTRQGVCRDYAHLLCALAR